MLFCILDDMIGLEGTPFVNRDEYTPEVWHDDRWIEVQAFHCVGDWWRVIAVESGVRPMVKPDAQLCLTRVKRVSSGEE